MHDLQHFWNLSGNVLTRKFENCTAPSEQSRAHHPVYFWPMAIIKERVEGGVPQKCNFPGLVLRVFFFVDLPRMVLWWMISLTAPKSSVENLHGRGVENIMAHASYPTQSECKVSECAGAVYSVQTNHLNGNRGGGKLGTLVPANCCIIFLQPTVIIEW